MNHLPVVKPEIGGSLQREISHRNDIEYVKEQLLKLDEQNPTISRFIKRFSKTTKDRLGAAFCGIVIYRMLESQAEANWMSE